jgi:hypothetical protein
MEDGSSQELSQTHSSGRGNEYDYQPPLYSRRYFFLTNLLGNGKPLKSRLTMQLTITTRAMKYSLSEIIVAKWTLPVQ